MLAVVDWSWQHLTPARQSALTLLSAFDGGATLQAVCALLGGAPPDTAAALDDLVAISVAYVRQGSSGRSRYHAFEPVREFVLSRLDTTARPALQQQQLQAMRAWAHGLGHAPALDAFRDELPNLLSALATAQSGDQPGLALQLALDDKGTTTFAAGTTVRGHSGTIGGAIFVDGTPTLVNDGTFNADVAGGTINISRTPLTNNGLLRAQAGTMNASTALTGTGTPQVDATGVMNLAAGAKTQGTLVMGATGAALNLNTGNLTISSDYTNTGADPFGVQGQINAVANVINQASPLVNTPAINLGAVRVGAAAPNGTVSVSNVATAPPQAALNASIAPTTGPITASGSFSLLNPGGINNSSLVVGLNTGVAGNFTGANAGTATISLVSDANNVGGCSPNCQLNLASQVVNVEGKVYTQAISQLVTNAVDFGVVRVGDTVTARNITINNTAASTALNDTLQATLGGVGGPFTGSGTVAGIAAQGNGVIAVGLNTGVAGVYSPTGSVVFRSQNPDMADVSAGADGTVSIFAQVNNLANAEFDQVGGAGTLSQSGMNYLLDLGNVTIGQAIAALLRLDNDVGGPADVLSGGFNLAGADDFSYAGWNPLTGLAAGQATGNLGINWLASVLGLFTDTIVFNGVGTNASDTVGLAQTRMLTIRANVVAAPPPGGTVPEPSTLAPLLAAAAAGWAARRRNVAVAGSAS